MKWTKGSHSEVLYSTGILEITPKLIEEREREKVGTGKTLVRSKLFHLMQPWLCILKIF